MLLLYEAYIAPQYVCFHLYDGTPDRPWFRQAYCHLRLVFHVLHILHLIQRLNDTEHVKHFAHMEETIRDTQVLQGRVRVVGYVHTWLRSRYPSTHIPEYRSIYSSILHGNPVITRAPYAWRTNTNMPYRGDNTGRKGVSSRACKLGILSGYPSTYPSICLKQTGLALRIGYPGTTRVSNA